MKILALLDDRPGNNNQTISVAEKLAPGGKYETLQVEYSFAAGLPNFLVGDASLSGLNFEEDISKINPDIVISSGRRLARLSAYLKQNTDCFNICLMWPGNAENFDMIFVPEHDAVPEEENIYRITGAPNRIDEEYLVQQKEYWQDKLPDFKGKTLGILAGGISNEEALEVIQMANTTNLPAYVSTSRRTSANVANSFRKHLAKENYVYDFQDGEKNHYENPYGGILALADYIICTGDSVGMLSEACSTGKPVFVYESTPKAKIARFHHQLHQKGMVKSLLLGKFEKWSYKPLCTRDEVVEQVQKALKSQSI